MNNNNIKFRQKWLAGTAIVIFSLISGCAALNLPQNGKVDVSEYSNLTTVDAVKQLESNLKKSKANKLAVFAPEHYSTADQALEEARTLISKNEPRAQVVQKVAVASAVLKNGDIVMRKVKDILEDQLTVKKKLDSLETKKVYRSEYGSLEGRLNNIIREIENGDLLDNEQNRGELLRDLQKLERRSIRYNAMHEPEEILKRVKYRGGEKLAPLTYLDAVAVFKRAEDFIDQNPNYETGIDQMGQEALFAAKRALYITEQVAALSQKVSISLEQVILDEEYRLYRVARELNAIDLRDNPLEMQSEQLAKIAKNKADEYKNKEELILALRDTLIKVRDSSVELTALNETRLQLKKEKSEWLAKEALFTAKVSHLEENLNKSQTQLDQTQQKLLSIKEENNQLVSTIDFEKENSNKLNAKVNQAKDQIDQLKTTATAKETLHLQNQEKIKRLQATEAQLTKKLAAKPKVIKSKTVDVAKKPTIKPTKQPLTLTEENKTKKSVNKPSQESEEIVEQKPEPINSPASQIDNKKPEKLASSATQKDDKTRAKITKKETMDALNSVMSLISAKPTDGKKQKTNDETFVDASE